MRGKRQGEGERATGEGEGEVTPRVRAIYTIRRRDNRCEYDWLVYPFSEFLFLGDQKELGAS